MVDVSGQRNGAMRRHGAFVAEARPVPRDRKPHIFPGSRAFAPAVVPGILENGRRPLRMGPFRGKRIVTLDRVAARQARMPLLYR